MRNVAKFNTYPLGEGISSEFVPGDCRKTEVNKKIRRWGMHFDKLPLKHVLKIPPPTIKMYTKCAVLAFIGSAVAFSPQMSVSTGRRAAISGAGAAAIAAPLLRPDSAEAANGFPGKMQANPKAPVITFFDARAGCSRESTEYKGAKTSSEDDYMCVKLQMAKLTGDSAQNVLAGVLGQF